MFVGNRGLRELPAEIACSVIKIDEPKALGMSTELVDLALPLLNQAIDTGLKFEGPIGFFIRQGFEAMHKAFDLAADVVRQSIHQRQKPTSFSQSEPAWTENLDNVQ